MVRDATRYDYDNIWKAPMAKLGNTSRFESVSWEDLPHGRNGKHKSIVLQLLHDLEELKDGRALKIPLSELPDSKANIRSALNRATKQKNLKVATSSDDKHLYVWKVS